jgi:hypothetical protein
MEIPKEKIRLERSLKMLKNILEGQLAIMKTRPFAAK